MCPLRKRRLFGVFALFLLALSFAPTPTLAATRPALSNQTILELLSGVLTSFAQLLESVPRPSAAPAANTQQVAAGGNAAVPYAAAQNISSLSGVTINNPTVTGLSASAIPDLSGTYLSLNGGSVSGNLAVSGALTASSSALTNFTATNATSTTFFSSYASTTNATSTTLFSTVGHFTAGIIDSLTSTFANIANLIVTNSTTTNATTTNLYAASATIPTLSGTSATFSGNVGIGTTSPLTTFAVSGNGYFSGGLTATNATSTNLYASSLTAGNIVAPVQQLNPYALRSTRTKAGLIALNLGGYSGYSTPAQIYMVIVGDSTAAFHAGELDCTLASQYGYAGYIFGGLTGNITKLGFNCVSSSQGYFAPTLAGGAALDTGDFAHFPNGSGYSIPSGGSVTATGYYLSTRQIAYYTADTSGATITVSTSPDGSTWTPLPACNGVSVTAGVGGVCDTTITSGNYYLRVSASGGTVYLWGVGQVNTTVNGVVSAAIGVGGISLPDVASTPSAIVAPWFADIHPDLVTFEMKDNGVAGANCTQAPTATPSNLQSRSYWWNIWTGEWQTANPLADFVIFGSYPINDACIPVYNTVEQQWANTTSPQQTYLDNYSQLTNVQMQSLGWIDTSVHETPLGQIAHSDLDMQYLGIMQWPTAVVGQNVSDSLITTKQVSIGTTGYLKNDNYNLDVSLGANRGFAFYNQSTSSPLEYAYLGDPSQAFGFASNFLPPFQSSDYTGGALVKGPWIYGNAGMLYVNSSLNGSNGGTPQWINAGAISYFKTTATNSTLISTSSAIYANTLTSNIGNVTMSYGGAYSWAPIIYQTIENATGGYTVGVSPSFPSFSEPNTAAGIQTTQIVMANQSGGGWALTPAIDSNGNSITKTGQAFISNSGVQSWISALSGGSFGLGTTLGSTNGSLSLTTLGVGTTTLSSRFEVWGPNTTNTSAFSVINNASTTEFSVFDNGNVGIGTTTPQSALDIEGGGPTLTLQTTNLSGGTPIINLIGGGGGGLFTSSITGGYYGGLAFNTSANSGINAFMTFSTANSEKMRITTGGLVGIGTTTPAARLEVWAPDTAASTTAFAVVNSASSTAFAVFDGGSAQLAGTLYQSSDQRLKTNVLSLDASTSLADIEGLNPVSYSRIDQPDQGTTLGFLAQQVAQIFPDLVSTTSPTALTPDGTLTLNYTGLIAPMVKAIQALSTEFNTLAQTITTGVITAATGNFQQVNTSQLCVQGTCVSGSQLAALLAEAGTSTGTAGAAVDPSGASSTTPPVIQINGNNPAVIQVGSTYSDLGATITGPTQDLNLGTHLFLNGASVPSIELDTTQAATDTIDYVVTDQSGLTATSTRIVIVQAAVSVNATSTGE